MNEFLAAGYKKDLVLAAVEARKYAYAPYSKFTVGAALQTQSGRIYTGCNIESAAYSPTICAERTAVFKAVSEGYKNFRSIAIVGGKAGESSKFCPPCGVCLQVLLEFCDPDTFEVLLSQDDFHTRAYMLSELMPEGFRPEHLL